jgi:hypothetical protein
MTGVCVYEEEGIKRLDRLEETTRGRAVGRVWGRVQAV